MRLEAWVLAATFALLPQLAHGQARPKASAAPAASPVRKVPLDANQHDALLKTKDLLRSPQARAEVIRSDPKAKAAHRRAEAVGRSPKNTQRIYEISADVFGDLAARAEGDPARMSQMVEAAERDPAAFLESLSPEQRAAIRQLAAEISRENPGLGGQALPGLDP